MGVAVVMLEPDDIPSPITVGAPTAVGVSMVVLRGARFDGLLYGGGRVDGGCDGRDCECGFAGHLCMPYARKPWSTVYRAHYGGL